LQTDPTTTVRRRPHLCRPILTTPHSVIKHQKSRNCRLLSTTLKETSAPTRLTQHKICIMQL